MYSLQRLIWRLEADTVNYGNCLLAVTTHASIRAMTVGDVICLLSDVSGRVKKERRT
jgi:hypothetical protein